MRPNFFHSASSSISWPQQQQQLKEKGVLAPFPYNHHQQQGTGNEGTSFHRGVNSQLMNMESSSPSSTHLNYSEGDEINDHVVLGRALLDTSEHMESTTPLMEKEHMFDKVVTPSDVGKLNRLVIPKQYAEKYFPLDSSSNEKGLLLNFEDRNGKPWRFRYSYWNSSQSYVMTKGWSRFVKDKKLDAGDVVSFLRGVGELGKDRLFIDWRRRPTAPPFPPPSYLPSGHHYFSFHPYFCRDHHPNTINPHHSSSHSYGGLMNGNPFPSPLIYYRSPIPQMVPAGSGAAIDEEHDPMVFESVPVVQGKAAAKRLRLFGVNMDCPITETSEPEIILSSTAVHHDHPPMLANPPPSASNSGNFYSPSSSSSSTIRAYPNFGAQVQRKMFPDNKGKGSLSLDFDV